MAERPMKNQSIDFDFDIHEKLQSYSDVLAFFEAIELNGVTKKYCNGANRSGRWIFQIYNREFIQELSVMLNRFLREDHGIAPILEVMCGDGRLTELLRPKVQREMIASDAKDGRYGILYPKWVESLDAIESIKKYNPSFIILSWEPYQSMTGIDIVQFGIPTAWIGNPKMCGHPDLFRIKHVQLGSRYALCRHDSFAKHEFNSDVFFFNCKSESIIRPS